MAPKRKSPATATATKPEVVKKGKSSDGVAPPTKPTSTRTSARLAAKPSAPPPAAAVPEVQKKVVKKSVTEKVKEKVKVVVEEEGEGESDFGSKAAVGKTIVIEHCKQCNRFKVRATKVKADLEKSFPGIKVLLNPEKPRRGCFEVREEGGEPYISLLDLKRPFKKMTDLDMDEVVADIIKKINKA